MKKHYVFLTAIFCAGLVCSAAMADSLAWWRFEDGVAGEAVVHNAADGVWCLGDVVDQTGNGNDLSPWNSDNYGYRATVCSEYMPVGGKNALSVKNLGTGPAMECSSESMSTMQPLAWTLEISFKLENNGWKTFIGRDGDDVVGDNAMVFFQVRGDLGPNQLAIKYCDVGGYMHNAQTDTGVEIYDGFNFSEDNEGETARWYSAVATCDGTWLRLYGMQYGDATEYTLLAETDVTLSGSPDLRLNNGSTGRSDAGDWQPGEWSVGRGLWGGGHVDRAYGFVDEIRISDAALIPAQFLTGGGAYNHSVEQESDLVNQDVDVVLSWNAGQDPAGVANVNPAIVNQHVFVADATDPNLPFLYVGSTNADPGDVAASSISFNVDFDKTYKVCILEEVGGLAVTPEVGVTNIDEVADGNITSLVYTFDATPSVPVITANPAGVLAEMDGTAEYTVDYISVTTPTVQWYSSADNLNDTVDDDVALTTGDTLTLSAVTAADEAFYYATVTNESGVTATSAPAYLEVKRLVSHYSFDDNTESGTITDLTGYANGTVTNDADPNIITIAYEATADGYAASFVPDTGTYVSVPRMVQNSMTIEAWVKTSTGAMWDWWNGRGILDGEMPGDVADFGVALAHYDKFVYGVFSNQLASTTVITDGEWHYCVATRDSFTGDCAVYVDGVQEATATNPTVALTVPETLSIGDILSGGNIFDGQIDDIKVSNYPLTEMEIAQIYSDATGESVCVTSNRPEALYDKNGDCVVGLADFAVFATGWLDCGIYPDCL
ncbi:MAG: LamG-like jellyroll fold domain-containing protein [Phycisphaerae bacterium]